MFCFELGSVDLRLDEAMVLHEGVDFNVHALGCRREGKGFLRFHTASDERKEEHFCLVSIRLLGVGCGR